MTAQIATRREAALETLPVDPALLERANLWFDISWYVIFFAGFATALGAFATLAFLVLQYWSSGIKERHTEWRTSTLELETGRAKAELGRANEAIAKANAETAKALERAAELRLDLQREHERVSDRKATEEQMRLLREASFPPYSQYNQPPAGYKPFPPFDIAYVDGDGEAELFAYRLHFLALPNRTKLVVILKEDPCVRKIRLE